MASSGASLVVLVACAGAAALSWEVLYRHALGVALGISAVATAITLAVTMGGMTLGALGMARLLARRDRVRPLVVYAALEATIGLASLAVAPLLSLMAHVDTALFRASPLLAQLVEPALVALPLVVPTCAMGATMPVLALVASSRGVPLARLYGANTLGAAVGTLALAFVLLPRLGVMASSLAVAAIDFGAALFAFVLGRGAPPMKTSPVDETGGDLGAPRFDPRAALVVAFVTGTATFVVEVAGFRALIASLWSTTEAFALLLFAVLLALGAVAPFAVRVVDRLSLGGALATAGVLVVALTPLIARFEQLLPFPDGYAVRMAAWGALSLLALGPAIAALGSPLPALLDDAARAPLRVARLYAVNTCGAVLGALTTAFVLLPTIGSIVSLVVVGALVGGVGAFFARGRTRLFALVSLALVVVVAIATDDGTGRTKAPTRLAQKETHRVLALREGPDVTTAVVERADRSRALLIDGFAATEESSPAHYMAWMGHLPMMLHERPERALVICFGTGQTAHAVRKENPRTLDVVDVNPAVFDVAPFFRTNNDVLKDPRVKTHVMDGRAFLRRTEQRFDVVTLEPMPPTFAGVNSLYSEEFYRLVHGALDDGGVLAQWLPFHIVSPKDARAIAASFRAVFEDSALWVDPASGTGILVGRKGARRDLGLAFPGAARPDLGRSLPQDIVPRMMLLLPDGMAEYTSGAGRVTDDNQRLAYGLDRIDRHGELLGRANRMNLDEVMQIAKKTRGDAVPTMQ